MFTLALIAFAINADYHDSNNDFDYDQQTVDFYYASSFASENYHPKYDTYWYSAYAYASYSIESDIPFPDGAYWSLSVDATSMESDSDSGITFPGSSKYMSVSGGHMYEQNWASSYASMGSACAYAGIYSEP